MLKDEVVTAFLFLTRLNEFFKRGNKPIFCGCDFAHRIDGNRTIGVTFCQNVSACRSRVRFAA